MVPGFTASSSSGSDSSIAPIQAMTQHRPRVDPRRRMSIREQRKVRRKQPTSSAVRTLEIDNDAVAKRQKLMAWLPIFHEADVNVNRDAHEMVVLAVMPDDQGQWTQWVIDWSGSTTEPRVEFSSTHRKCMRVS